MKLRISATDRIVLKLSKLEFKWTRRKKIDFGNELTVLNESSSSRVFVILTNWSFGPQKNNDLVFEFKGEGCHRTAKSQDNYTSVNSSGAHAPPPPGISIFLKKMGKFPAVGTHKLSKCPEVRTKKEGKCAAPDSVAFQHF